MKWQINIDNTLGGLSPSFYFETYPSYGNKNQAGAMQNIDLTGAGYLTQGPGLSNLTGGTQAGAMTTIIRSVLDGAVEANSTYGVGGNIVYQVTNTTLTAAHTIDKGGVTGETGEDVSFFQGNIYYTYNHSGSAGDIGKYNLSAFDDDWGSTAPSGAAALLGSYPHPLEVGLNDIMYFGNQRYVGSYDGSVFDDKALDLPVGSVVYDLAWNADRLYITANNPNLVGFNKIKSSIYIWDGTADSWETEIKLMGTVRALHVKNAVVYVFYKDISSVGGYKLGYISGNQVIDLANFTDDLPNYYQVTDYKDFIIWNNTSDIWAYGSGDKNLPARLFQLASPGYVSGTSGCLSSPFGVPIVASTDEAGNFRIAKFGNYDTACNWKSLMFDLAGMDVVPAKVNAIRINFEMLTSGARVDWRIITNQGKVIYSDTISYAKLGAATTAYYPLNGKVAENLRLEYDFTNGSTTAPVKIKNAKIYGTN